MNNNRLEYHLNVQFGVAFYYFVRLLQIEVAPNVIKLVNIRLNPSVKITEPGRI